MRFDILGPLRISDHAGEHPVSAGRDRTVLAMLLLHPGHIVAVDQLIDAVWEKAPPATARGQLQTCVSRLRRLLPGTVVATDPAGYRIELADGELDAADFARHVDQARRILRDRPDEARRLFRSALDLWRGPALAGIDSRAVRQGAAVLDEQRGVTTEDWVDLELAGGRERDLLAELAGLVEQFPLRERLRAQLMLALYRAGRQADALTEYRRGRSVLLDELGVEPGAGLRDMHQRILTGVEQVTGPPGPPGPAAPVRCLPRTVNDFTGRDGTVARLVADVERADAATPVVHVIDGMAGSGKTTLALHLAARLGEAYPDAHLFVDLHGHSEREPVAPAAALTTLLRQLGVAAERIPAPVDERITMWRTELAARRALIVLDNAAGTSQILPLLPPGPGCLTLVTSRRRLTGLDGVRPESLPLLTDDEAVTLLERIVGPRVAEQPAAALEVVRRCGRLPLAIRLAGARLAHRQRWRMSDLLDRLGEPGSGLPELAAEDRTVSDAFALSYGQLDSPARRVFRLLGLLPGPLFDPPAVAALADLPLTVAQDILDDLVDMHLVEEPEAGLHRLHDLMREYAATLADADPEVERHAAIARLLDHEIAVAWSFTGPLEADPSAPRKLSTLTPRRPDLTAAVTDVHRWLEWNRAGLPAMIEAAVRIDDDRTAWLLPRVVWRFFYLNGYYDDIERSQLLALAAARRAGDDVGMGECLNYLASAYFRTSRIEEAQRILDQSLRIYLRIGDEWSVVRVRGNLAGVLLYAGQYLEALEEAVASVRGWRRLDDWNLPRALASLGLVLLGLGRLDEAMRCHRLHLLIGIERRNLMLKSIAFGHLGQVRLRLGQPATAVRLLRMALKLKMRSGYRFDQVDTHSDLAVALGRTGRVSEAVKQHRVAVALARQLGEPRAESLAYSDFADTLLATGDVGQALALFRTALDGAVRSASLFGQARAHEGIGICLADPRLAGPDPKAARRHWQLALDILERLQVPERDRVRRRLHEVAALMPRQSFVVTEPPR